MALHDFRRNITSEAGHFLGLEIGTDGSIRLDDIDEAGYLSTTVLTWDEALILAEFLRQASATLKGASSSL